MVMDPISLAISRVPGGQKALATHLSVSPQAVNQWVKRSRPVPPRLALAIESLTGVSRHELRPDVFGPARTDEQAA
jgi:DNA-binding transcriptional regulator YdaS (Cro superfamily)